VRVRVIRPLLPALTAPALPVELTGHDAKLLPPLHLMDANDMCGHPINLPPV
jgi:hypothetical protein